MKGVWLSTIGLGKYSTRFRDSAIDGSMLLTVAVIYIWKKEKVIF